MFENYELNRSRAYCVLEMYGFVLNTNTTKHSILYACWKQTMALCVFCCLYNIDIFQYVTRNSTFTRPKRLSFIILELIPMFTLVFGSACMYMYKGHLNTSSTTLSQSPVSSVGIFSYCKSHGYGFESHCDFVFVAFDAFLAGRLVPYKWNKAWRSSEVYRCIERKKNEKWKKNGNGTSS